MSNLFDVSGNTSLGGLPRGEIHVRHDSHYVTSPSPDDAHQFAIGAKASTPEVPPAWLRKGNEELARRNLVARRVTGAGNRVGKNMTAPNIKVKTSNVPASFVAQGAEEQ